MALELGLGITPWSPLRSGVLSGKYTRRNAGQIKGDRGPMLDSFLDEKTYALIDELEVIARAHDTTVAAIALAWVRSRPGVASTIIGARRIGQLEDNLKSLAVTLTAEERAKLDQMTAPVLGFPQSMQPIFPSIHNGGTMVNGVQAPMSRWGLGPGEKPY
jgi:aryl-alcohol dehydrogenase-like predicted oxidoreductase